MHIVNGCLTFLAAGIFRALPLGAASAFGGWLARMIGPRLLRHRIARENIELVMPELDAEQVDGILTGMWDNLGRTVAEFAHLQAYSAAEKHGGDLITFAGMEHLEGLKRDYRGAIFVGGHLANWEITPLILRRAGLETVVVYRPPDTPYVDRLIRRQRAMINPHMAVKRRGTKALVSALRSHRSVSMLVDQRLWQGTLLPFFGYDAHTTTLPAKMALRYGVPIVPLRIERHDGTRFRITAYPPILPGDDSGRDGTTKNGSDGDAEIALTLAINNVLESWIRERPDQWQWLHRRWTIRMRNRDSARYKETSARLSASEELRTRRITADERRKARQDPASEGKTKRR